MKGWQIATALGLAGAVLFFVLKSKGSRGPVRVGLLGDSMVAGICGRVAGQVICSGHTGQGTAYILQHLNSVLDQSPTHVVVLAGVNDLASGRSVETVKSNLSWIYEMIIAAGAIPVAVQLTPWATHTKGRTLIAETLSVNAWIQSRSGIRWVNTSSLGDGETRLKSEYNAGDGLHLTSAGKQLLAELIEKKVK